MNKKILKNQFKEYQEKINTRLTEYAENKNSWRHMEVIITLLSITFFIIFAIRPAVLTISGLIGEINEKKETSKKMQSKINSVIIAQEEFALVQGKREILESYLPSKFSIIQGIVQIAGAASDSNLEINQMNIRGIENMISPGNEFSGLEFSYSSKGEYDQLKTFIKDLSLVRRWIDVSSYQVNLADEKDQPVNILNFNVRGDFNYWFEENYGKRS
jgi:Tfp pilus assembly protein PilO